MAYEQKDNSGTLFKNDRREKDTHPHATGTAMIDGVEYYVSAWTKEGKKGRFQSLSFKPKEARQERSQQRREMSGGSGDGVDFAPALDDEIPF